ncbi:MAG: ParB N-terminal domain-containing protein [Anaerolineae bacterium]|nr:ParB N-terminal domain-containing protein [Anaerolineae bacterium]
MTKRPNTSAIFAGALKRPTESAKIDGQINKPSGGAEAVQLSLEGSVQKIPLKQIKLDANQVRKLLPRELAMQLHSGKLGLVELMSKWAKQVGAPLSANYVPAELGNKRPDPSLEDLRELAHSIKAHDLIHPINVFAKSDGYLVHTGERRVLAHAWLVACGDEAFSQVKAIVVERGKRDATQKLIENLQRSDLSAYEQAIGLWMVRYELSEQELPDFNDPKVWKAHQGDTVAGADLVAWTAVDGEMGKSDEWRKQRLRVLKLSPESLNIIIDKRLPERTIRDLMRLKDDPKGQLFVLQRIDEAEANALRQSREADVWTSSRVRDEVNAWVTLNRAQKRSATPSGVDLRTARLITRAFTKVQTALGDKGLKGKDVATVAKTLASTNPGLVNIARQIKPVIEALVAQQ